MMFIDEVALAYAQAPTIVQSDVSAWRSLADESMALADKLKGSIEVSYTPHAQPYPTAYAMLAHLAQGRIIISTANCDHPVWTLEQNTAFRLVHDVVGHGATGSGFDWDGECRAYDKHWGILESHRSRAALFTEAVGQVAYALTRGHFTTQKVSLLPQWMQWHRAPGVEIAA